MFICLSILFLQLNFFAKSHLEFNVYNYAFICVLFHSLVNLSIKSIKRNRYVIIASTVLLISAVNSNIFGVTHEGFLETIFLIAIIPILICSTSINEQNYNRILKFISYSTLISVFFNTVKSLGVDNIAFVTEFTETAGVIHTRGNSVYGSSLTYASISFFQLLASIYLFKIHRKKSYLLLSLLATYCIIDSSSRRVMVPAVFLLLYIIYTKSRYLLFGLLILLVIFLISTQSFLITQRLLSVFDLISDEGNVSRLLWMLNAMESIVNNPLGIGPGGLSSIGKGADRIESNDFDVAESYYLVLIGEFGYIFILFYVSLLYYHFKFRVNKFKCIIFLMPCIIESLAGLSLLTPYGALILSLMIFSSVDVYGKQKVPEKLLKTSAVMNKP
jgi:hypothetical protein